jgi:hypothetical protein
VTDTRYDALDRGGGLAHTTCPTGNPVVVTNHAALSLFIRRSTVVAAGVTPPVLRRDRDET